MYIPYNLSPHKTDTYHLLIPTPPRKIQCRVIKIHHRTHIYPTSKPHSPLPAYQKKTSIQPQSSSSSQHNTMVSDPLCPARSSGRGAAESRRFVDCFSYVVALWRAVLPKIRMASEVGEVHWVPVRGWYLVEEIYRTRWMRLQRAAPCEGGIAEVAYVETVAGSILGR